MTERAQINPQFEDKPKKKILLITTEFPTLERPGGGAYIFRSIEALREQGVEVDILTFTSRANPVNHFNAWKQMKAKLRSESYNLIHAHFGHSGIIALSQSQVPVVITFHGSDLIGIVGKNGKYRLKGKIQNLLSRWAAKRANEVIVVAQHLSEKVTRPDFHVIPLGIPLEQFQPIEKSAARNELGWPIDKEIALFASLEIDNPVKNYSLAKQTIDLLAQTRRIELKTASGISPEEMPLYMSAADCLLLTSVHEGSPTVVKEALACNLPIVSTNVGDVKERIEGVSNCYICSSDPVDLARALTKVFLSGVRSNGREHIRYLDDAQVAQRVIAVYDKALGRSQSLRLTSSVN